ncbi:alpha/beta hydrolase [Kribbella italica]|uniref:Pimeloyl-ACP methyl ester carboxylesterase n=1 Tax=Kribbella italica TaxID=1540520 RepID=A0A7W9J571_9ACTN|nr:alpha/beta hydrolase [Kribbella italica]MBB5835595.1 pimeloyl-ACP methyl ester carboxylesterase [Kribbella italica]
MRKTLPAAIVAVAVAATAGGVSTASVSTASVAQTASRPAVQWGPCPADATGPGLQCATLDVPLDYRRPDGQKISVAFSRLASAKPEQRRGVLLLNQGGPGLGGLNFADTLVKSGLPQQVRDSYDLIGFDPRGIGHSTPLTCDLTPEQQGPASNPPAPKTLADVKKSAVFAKTVADQCAASATGSLLPYITTKNTARDMDRIREALGEPKLSYYGASYGTYLGAVYATMFPHRSDRVVLDSNLGPNGYDSHALRQQALGVQLRFPDFAKLVSADPDKYGLGKTPAAVTAKYYELAKRLEKTPALGYDGTLFRVITATYLRSDPLMLELATLWRQLETALDTGKTAPAVTERAAAPAGDNFQAGYFGVICGDSRWPTSVHTYQANVAIDRIRYPLYGAFAANIRPCAFWPDPIEPQVKISDRGPANVLMVQNLRDPATPMPLALKLRKAFGDRARLVTIDQGGHGAYVFTPSKCGNNTVTDFLVTGRRPAHDKFCPAPPA